MITESQRLALQAGMEKGSPVAKVLDRAAAKIFVSWCVTVHGAVKFWFPWGDSMVAISDKAANTA